LNYIPLLIYTALILRGGSAKSETEYALAQDPHYVRKYSIQQLLLFVPLAVLILAVVQELRQTQKPKSDPPKANGMIT